MKPSVLSEFERSLIKAQALCEVPFVFLDFPISEDACALFGKAKPDMTLEQRLLATKLCQAEPLIPKTEHRLVPKHMSSKRFWLVFFLMTSEPHVERPQVPKDSFLRNLEKDIEEVGGSIKEALDLEKLMDEAFTLNQQQIDSILT